MHVAFLAVSIQIKKKMYQNTVLFYLYETVMKSTLWLFNFFFCLRGDLACNIALDAVQTVARDQGDRKEIDIKNYAKVEKVRGL